MLRDAAKFFWFLLFLWFTLMFFTLFGYAPDRTVTHACSALPQVMDVTYPIVCRLVAVALTPNIKVAAVFSSNFYSVNTLLNCSNASNLYVLRVQR